MTSWSRRLWRAFTRNIAVTGPHADDPRLRGRTYAIPFERVWQAALALTGGGLRRWTLVHADDEEGIIRAQAEPVVLGATAEVTIRIGLDADAQTRVDARARSRRGVVDFGANARRIGKLFRGLDHALAVNRSRRVPTPQRIGG